MNLITPDALLEQAARAIERVESKLVLRDYDAKYAPLVTAAYDARPLHEAAADSSWHVAMTFIEKTFKQIESRLKVEFVDIDPYHTYEEMRKAVDDSGVLKVWTGASDTHPVWTPEQNWKFRAVHDYQSHLAGGHRFGLKGELASYNRHVKTFPQAARPCLFTEIIGQTCALSVTGTNPVQKVCILHGFDYVNIGIVDEAAYQLNFEETNE